RTAANAEGRRGLLLRELEEVAAGHGVAMLVGEALDGGQQPLLRLPGEQSRLGGRDRVPRTDLGGRPQREPLAPNGRAVSVARLVRHDPEQPWRERRPPAEPAQCAVRLDEAVLSRLLG